MNTLKIADLCFCEALLEMPVDLTGGLSLGVYRGRRSFKKSGHGVIEKTGLATGSLNAPVVEPMTTEPAIFSTGVVTSPDGKFSSASGSLSRPGSLSIESSI